MKANQKDFTAPVNGIYYFYSQAQSYWADNSTLQFVVNGSTYAFAYRDEDREYDFVTLSSQINLKKGDIVCVLLIGTFHNPNNQQNTFFEGHLIHQINS